MPQKEIDQIHPKESAGRLMVANVPTIEETATVEDVEKLLIKEAKHFETINYIYVLTPQKKLKGVISIREVFLSPKKTAIKELMSKRPISVRAHTDQERVAFLALEHSLKVVPVVNKNDIFLGVVDNDKILEILHTEGVENMLRLGGMTKMKVSRYDNIFTLSIWTSIKHRLPWLIIGLLGGLGAASVVNAFEEVLARNLILAAYIPLIVYMADAVGTQMEAFIIRDLATDPELKLGKYFLRQAWIVILIAGFTGLMLYGISQLLYHDHRVSLVLVIGLFCAILSSLITGLLVPYTFGKLKLDPANASGPIATIIQDVLSILIYFWIASFILL